jgi:hypothetical protein
MMFEWSALSGIAAEGINAAIVRKAILGQEALGGYWTGGDPGREGVVPRQLACLVSLHLGELAGLCENIEQQKVAARKAEGCFKEVMESGKRLRLLWTA